MGRRISRLLSKVSLSASIALCAGASVAWIATTGGWARWIALQGPNTSYIAFLSSGNLTVHIADVSPDPARPATLRWRCFSAPVYMFGPNGSLRDTSPWSRLGLIRTVERIPYDDDEPYVKGT